MDKKLMFHLNLLTISVIINTLTIMNLSAKVRALSGLVDKMVFIMTQFNESIHVIIALQGQSAEIDQKFLELLQMIVNFVTGCA